MEGKERRYDVIFEAILLLLNWAEQQVAIVFQFVSDWVFAAVKVHNEIERNGA